MLQLSPLFFCSLCPMTRAIFLHSLAIVPAIHSAAFNLFLVISARHWYNFLDQEKIDFIEVYKIIICLHVIRCQSLHQSDACIISSLLLAIEIHPQPVLLLNLFSNQQVPPIDLIHCVVDHSSTTFKFFE